MTHKVPSLAPFATWSGAPAVKPNFGIFSNQWVLVESLVLVCIFNNHYLIVLNSVRAKGLILGVSVAANPLCDLDHCLFSSTTLTRLIGVPQIVDAKWVRSSKTFSDAVSRIRYRRRAFRRCVSFSIGVLTRESRGVSFIVCLTAMDLSKRRKVPS